MKRFKKLADRMLCRKLNNHGSTLLTVIICIAFIGVLGALMLSVTMTNLQMKMIESKSKKNFYSCESVMEKLRVGMQDIAAGAVKYVYENDVLTNYAAYLDKNKNKTEDDAEAAWNAEIQKKVIARIIIDLGLEEDTAGYADIITKACLDGYDLGSEGANFQLNNYFKANNYLTENENAVVSWSVLKCEGGTTPNPYILRFKDIKIEYVNENYRTAITSDIVITMPEFTFTGGSNEAHYRMDQPYKQYVLMADGKIISDNKDNMDVESTTSIQGNVYSGAGILVKGKNFSQNIVNINGSIIATGRDITVSDTATLNIGASGNPVKPVVWADNLVTSTSALTSSDWETSLNINGIALIRDDLTLDGRNSNVTLSGAYIGYTGAHTSKGSSMIVNGSSSTLNLSGLGELILAGRANVSVQDTALSKDTDILTGESIAIKSNQRAYLLPAEFIEGIGNNPVTQDECSGILPNVTINDTDKVIKYSKYVYSPLPYKIAAKQTGSTILRYYYLNFLRGWKADAYFTEFFNQYAAALNNMAPFSIDALTLPADTAIHTVGDVTGYNSVGGLVLKPGMSSLSGYAGDINAVYDDSTEASFDTSLDNYIAGITLSNTVYASTMVSGKNVGSLNSIYYDTFDTVASTLKTGGVNSIIEQGLGLSSDKFNDYPPYPPYRPYYVGDAVYKNSDPSKKSFWVIDGNVTISQPDDPSQHPVFNGIMIATGDITVSPNAVINGILISTGEKESGKITLGDNVSLNGRVITTGDIYLGQDCNLVADGTTDTNFDENIFVPETEILSNLFKNTNLTVDFTIDNTTSDYVDLSDMISYENWRRIE